MSKHPIFKKILVTSLATAMLVSGSTAVFADGRGKGHDKEKKVWHHPVFSKNWTPPGLKGQMEIKIKFDDIKGGDVEWALRYIASLASKRVFEGYEDGTFQPRKVITRIEAITAAVRLMGLRDEAESEAKMKTELNFKDADKIEQKYPWAVGYVAVALENDLFTESDTAVQPDKEADRLWATTLLVKALKLEDEAKAKMNTQLNFRDANEIPAGSVGYVAVAVERGLINGYENNTFRPNKPVTRAELAALLDRTGSQMPDYNNSLLEGKISTSVSGNVLTVVKNGQTYQIALHSDALILRNNTRVSASALKVGDEVKVYVYNNTATLVEVTKMAEEEQLNGTVEGVVSAAVDNDKLKITKNGQVQELTLKSDVIIYRNGAQVAKSAIKVGDEIRAFVYNNAVTFIDVTKPVDQNYDFTVEGRFQSMTINSQGKIATISVTQNVYNSSSQVSIYNVSPDVTIVGDPEDLKPNEEVELQIRNNLVQTIEID